MAKEAWWTMSNNENPSLDLFPGIGFEKHKFFHAAVPTSLPPTAAPLYDYSAPPLVQILLTDKAITPYFTCLRFTAGYLLPPMKQSKFEDRKRHFDSLALECLYDMK